MAISDLMIADQGNVQTFAGSADARLYYLDLDGNERKYLLEGEGGPVGPVAPERNDYFRNGK